MCGIAGFFSLKEQECLNFLQERSTLLRHRGPDDEGYLLLDEDLKPIPVYGNETREPESIPGGQHLDALRGRRFRAGFLHRRLAILDTGPAGHQPFSDEDGKVWITYNGEIYNFKSLRAELEKTGIRFRTQGDTEVLLHAWKFWGPDCLHKLEGMWSFALIDLRQNLFFAATDHAGIKPFYYLKHGPSFFFASEIKAVPGFDLHDEPDAHELARFLAFGQSDETEKTLFKGVRRLAAGHSISFRLDRESEISPQCWNRWQVNADFESISEQNHAKEAEGIRRLLLDSLALRLQSEVPLGMCLSGGIDSSAVAGMVASLSRNKQLQFPSTAFMATLPEGTPGDESLFARRMADKAGLEFCSVSPAAADFLKDLPDLMYSLESPPPGMNAYSQYAVFRLVSEKGVKVTLDGQGADEVFAGYPAHMEAGLWEALQNGRFGNMPVGNFKRMLSSKIRDLFPVSMNWSLTQRLKPEYAIFRREILEMAGPKNPRPMDGLNARLEWDFTSGILPFLLKAADRNSMRWSVESRMPFADTAGLVRQLFSIPGNVKITGGRSKSLLRAAAEPYVPAEILNRRDKVGFAAPNQIWLKELIQSDFAKSLPVCDDYLDVKELTRWSAKFLQQPDAVDSSLLWRAYAFRIWYAVFFNGNSQFGKAPSQKLV
jgi:asparagine synthase (glutamine-hydrolysing)